MGYCKADFEVVGLMWFGCEGQKVIYTMQWNGHDVDREWCVTRCRELFLTVCQVYQDFEGFATVRHKDTKISLEVCEF